jgi:pimeloyl-ACP methyl ester carboxylesterase
MRATAVQWHARPMSEMTINGVSLYYEEHGTGASIVGIHGAGSSAAVWADAIEVLAEQLGTIAQPTLLVASKQSPPAFAKATKLMAAAMPSARIEWVEGGHLIHPAHPAVLGFVDEVVVLKEEPCTA